MKKAIILILILIGLVLLCSCESSYKSCVNDCYWIKINSKIIIMIVKLEIFLLLILLNIIAPTIKK